MRPPDRPLTTMGRFAVEATVVFGAVMFLLLPWVYQGLIAVIAITAAIMWAAIR